MRRAMILTIFGAVLSLTSLLGISHAQTTPGPSIYAVKFVCGTQQPNPRLTAPAEPPVKAGNYATVINIQSFAPTNSIETRISVANSSTIGVLPVVVGPTLTLGILQTGDVTCADIAEKLLGSPNPGFITGFLDIVPAAPVSVTSVYTSQGCTFFQAFVPPACSGPTSIGVVPQQPVVLPPSTTIAPAAG